ncbi:DUF5704 domain-containing protein [Paenibacillus sp. N1-5-1-14]|uniref:DUF5704 domain-containing protein n=1 Tax=Paenibacillus radicibacter TaxID=2972488 RepID=UPI002158D626|nr:DUF5704 domain-containing protein [Paenibacillus radicibacter]MCR8643205.1 DUF5704 domain-containing protein [Paenibacillus radicibacter]
MKKYCSILLVLSMFIGLLPNIAVAAEPEYVVDLGVDDSFVIQKHNDNIISGYSKWSYDTVTIPAPPPGKYITEVYLRNKNKKDERIGNPLKPDVGNKFKVGDIQSIRSIDLKKTETTGQGNFTWWRDETMTNVWMYDFEGSRMFYRYKGKYDQPRATGAEWASLPRTGNEPNGRPFPSEVSNFVSIDSGGANKGDTPITRGDEAWDYRNHNIITTHLESDDGLRIEIDKLKDVKVDFDEDKGLEHYPTVFKDKVKNIKLDLKARTLKFWYLALFDVDGQVTSEAPNRKLVYFNNWKLTFTGQVYEFPPIEIVAIYGDKPGETCKPGDPDCNSGGPTCSSTLTGPSDASSMTGEVSDPQSDGVIKADTRHSERFDVLQGIPTSESLYANAFGLEYLYKNKFTNKTGKYTFKVTVTKTYNMKWKEPGGKDKDGKPLPDVDKQDTKTIKKDYNIDRDFSYWVIDNLEVNKIEKATMANYALSGSVDLQPQGYTPPTVDAKNSDSIEDHVTPASCDNVDLGTEEVAGKTPPPEDFKSDADGAVGENQVKNDFLNFNGSVIMDNSSTEKTAPTPGEIPKPKRIDENVLYGNGYVISKSLINKESQPSSGTIYYQLITPGNIKGGSDKNFPINNINTVTVHTPVVIYASISDDKAHNQKTVPAWDRSATILDRPFTIHMPTDGQHRNIPGYGDRDYAKYVRDKQVWFPFDVYNGDKSKFYAKETWISIPVNQEATKFFMPVWVDEGFYDVLFRTIAENAPDPFTNQHNANLDLTHHVASDVIPVDVIGRLYDFRITDVQDFNWETVFRTQQGASTHTGNYYWSGPNQIDGDPRGNQAPFLLPIRQGSHPEKGYRNVSVKTGYTFKFDMKTKGDMFRFDDSIRVTPTFYYVDKNGQNRQEVDLYYHSDDKRFIQIGSKDDVQKRYMVLDQRLRNVPASDITRSSSALWELFSKPLNWKMDKKTYSDAFAEHVSKEKKYIGGYALELLISDVRMLIGQQYVPLGVNPYRVQAAEQQWYGEYSIPAAVYVVGKGTNIPDYGIKNVLDEKSKIFLKDGYIIVNFNLETIQNRDFNNPHLQYIHTPAMLQTDPNRNQWTLEGYRRSFTDPYGKTFNLRDGDVVFYHADQSSYDDFRSGGTH